MPPGFRFHLGGLGGLGLLSGVGRGGISIGGGSPSGAGAIGNNGTSSNPTGAAAPNGSSTAAIPPPVVIIGGGANAKHLRYEVGKSLHGLSAARDFEVEADLFSIRKTGSKRARRR
ncbi:unnamed protein product [Tilletia controversa]|nr:unnamed protein product [Tilletia controversa]